MPNSNSNSNHKNNKNSPRKKYNAVSKNTNRKGCNANQQKVIAFENSIACQASQSDINRASYLFNSLQRQIIKTRIAQINLN